jgi:Fe-S-cluster containining protein
MRRQQWRKFRVVERQPGEARNPAAARSHGHSGDPQVEGERIAYRYRVDAFAASRDAGWALTRDALRDGVTVDALVSAAARSAAFADEALKIVEHEYRPAIACREGCSYCCCKPGVLVSIPEVLRLAGHVRAAFDPARLADLKERAARYVAQLHGRHFNDLVSESVPCPLLVDGHCSVYEVRPLVCRGFNSTSVDACRHAHDNRDALIPTFAIFKDVTDGATVGVAHYLKSAGLNDSVVDLGTSLHMVLEAGEMIGDALLNGAHLLETAEDPTWVGALWDRIAEIARQVGVKVPSAIPDERP